MKFRLKELRENRKLTQYELAKLTDLTPATIANYERGTKKQYSHEVLEKFCEILDCDPSELFEMEVKLLTTA